MIPVVRKERWFLCILQLLLYIALDMRENLMIIGGYFFLISHCNHTFQMMGHKTCFDAELTKIIPIYHQILHSI